jgi:glycosyltransferase involved in cell wall biosynthesis
MRVLQLVHQYPPEYVGGVELYTQSLAQTLGQRGHEIAILTRGEATGAGWAMEQRAATQVYRAWSGVLSPAQRFLVTWGNRALVEAVIATLDQVQPDLVHIQHLMGWPTTLVDVLRARGLPYLVTLHDYWWVCANANLLTNYSHERCAGPRGYVNCAHCVVARAQQSALWAAAPALIGGLAWRAQRLRAVLAGAAHLLTPSTFVRQWYAAHGIPVEQMQVCALGVERPPAHFVPQAKTGQGGMRFLYLGGIAPLKGVHVIVEALRQVRGAAELWIAGDLAADADYSQGLQQQATASMRFLGRLTRQQVWESLSQVDAVLVPSLWHETYCLAAREAQVAGVPVLASALGALTEAVTHEVNGLLVPPGDVAAWATALQRCIDQPELLPHFRAQLPTPPTVDEHVDRVEAVYQGLVGKQVDR